MLFWTLLRNDRREQFDPRNRVIITGKEYRYQQPSRNTSKPMAFETLVDALDEAAGGVVARVEIKNPLFLYRGGIAGESMKIVASANAEMWLHQFTFECAKRVWEMIPKPENDDERLFRDALLYDGLDLKQEWLNVVKSKNKTSAHLLAEELVDYRSRLDRLCQEFSCPRNSICEYWLYYLAGRAVRFCMTADDFDSNSLARLCPDTEVVAYAYHRWKQDGETEETMRNRYEYEEQKRRRLAAEMHKGALELLKRRSRYVEAA